MAKKRKQWVYSPKKESIPSMDEGFKAEVETKAQKLIDEVLKPKHVKPAPKDARFNYISDIKLKWYRSSLLFMAIYACPGPNALAPSFEAKFARMQWFGGGRFDLAFMRHTGAWVPLYEALPVDECLKAIREDPWFHP